MDLMPWMQQQGMLPAAGETVLCAVSGGRDSVCLLHYLASLGRRRGFAVAAAHYNHLMRPTAGRDEAFVAGLCRELGVPLYVERGDVRAIARQEGWGVEEAGRRLRYDFLERTADAIGASRIATAHHLSDQAETVVLNLLRGTGPEGLAGIPPVRGRLIRPLLQTPRQEIEAYLTAHGLGHVEDETNDSMDFTRNRLRREVWPLLAQLHPAPERSIARAAAILRRENVFLDRLARSYLETAVSDCPSAGEPNAPEIFGRRDPAAPSPAPPPGTLPEESSKSDNPSECTRTGDISPDFTSAPTAVSVSEAVLRSAPEELRPRMLRLLLERLPVGKKDVSAAHIEALLTLREGGMLDLPEGVTAWREKDVLHLEMTPPSPPLLTLSEGEQVWGDYLVRVWRSEKNTPPPDGEGLSKTGRFSDHILTLSDGGKMSEWTLRCPQRGDGLTLPGARGRRSVKRLLTERGMPPRRRRTTPVVCINGEPAAVYGVGTDQRFLPGKDGSSINILMIEKDQEEESNG